MVKSSMNLMMTFPHNGEVIPAACDDYLPHDSEVIPEHNREDIPAPNEDEITP